LAINKSKLEEQITKNLVENMLSDDIPDDVRPDVERAMRDMAKSIVAGIDLLIIKSIDLNDEKIKAFEQKISQLEAQVNTAQAAIDGNTTTIATLGTGA